MLRIAALCNDAKLISEEGRTRIAGDPTEGALVTAAAKFGLERAALERETPRVQEAAFDSVRKRMSTIHRGPAGVTEALVKGAPDLLLARCAKIRINGREEPLTDEWRHRILEAQGDNGALDNTKEFVVPPGHYFMMGDNRDNSSDSRDPNGGVNYVPVENMVGRAEFLFFSTDGSAHLWEPWKWPFAIRYDRPFEGIR
jgi:hypothetical protein